MKRIFTCLIIFALLLAGCAAQRPQSQIAATTLPVYEFTVRLCEGTGITAIRLVTESVSCLHDYSLNVNQVKAVEGAEVVVISGGGLEEFLDDLLAGTRPIDASQHIDLLCGDTHGDEHGHDHAHEDDHGHSHENDPHIWLSPENAKIMASNICESLCQRYPEHMAVFNSNLEALLADLDALQAYGEMQLAALSCRELITFHDGFAYFADSFGLTILEVVEEESGSEASAQELKHLITMVQEHQLPAIFVESNGSVSAAGVIARETGANVYSLDMAMGGASYFDAMYHNIDTIKEALE